MRLLPTFKDVEWGQVRLLGKHGFVFRYSLTQAVVGSVAWSIAISIHNFFKGQHPILSWFDLGYGPFWGLFCFGQAFFIWRNNEKSFLENINPPT
jgi:hypothetical protein